MLPGSSVGTALVLFNGFDPSAVWTYPQYRLATFARTVSASWYSANSRNASRTAASHGTPRSAPGVTGRNTCRHSEAGTNVVLVKGFWKVDVDVTPAMDGLTLFRCHQQLHMDYGFKLLFNVV
jgi:hypothetical protein